MADDDLTFTFTHPSQLEGYDPEWGLLSTAPPPEPEPEPEAKRVAKRVSRPDKEN